MKTLRNPIWPKGHWQRKFLLWLLLLFVCLFVLLLMLCVGKAYPVDQYWLDQLARIGSKRRRKAPITKSLHPKKQKIKKANSLGH